MPERIPGLTDADFTAHALPAATRADLVERLADQGGVPRERLRAQLAACAAKVVAAPPAAFRQD